MNPDGKVVADLPQMASDTDAYVAKRLAACWNALRGVDTSDLEEGKVVVVRVEDWEQVVRAAQEGVRALRDHAARLENNAAQFVINGGDPGDRYPQATIAGVDRMRERADTWNADLSRIQQNPSGGEQG